MVPFLQGSSPPASTDSGELSVPSCREMLCNCVTWAGERCCHTSLEHVRCANIGLSVKDSIVIVVY